MLPINIVKLLGKPIRNGEPYCTCMDDPRKVKLSSVVLSLHSRYDLHQRTSKERNLKPTLIISYEISFHSIIDRDQWLLG